MMPLGLRNVGERDNKLPAFFFFFFVQVSQRWLIGRRNW